MEKAYSNFADSLRTDATREVYDAALREFKRWARANSYNALVKVDAKAMQEKMIAYIKLLKVGRKLAPLSIRLKLAAVKHFLVMNDVVLNWPKIMKFVGSARILTRDRIYTKAEIQRILDKCDERKRVMFLLLVSTGIRIGALPAMRLSDLTRLDDLDLYRVVVYAHEPEEYVTFTSIECAKAIDSYLAYRKSKGESLKPNAPLIREQFNLTNADDARPNALGAFKSNLMKTLEDSGVRVRGNDSAKRHDVMRFHGFRKYFNTMLSQAGVKPVIKEMLMGHRVGLEKNYLRPSDQELTSEYLKAVDLLTISEEKQLQVKVQKLQIQNDQLVELLRNKIAALERANENRELFDSKKHKLPTEIKPIASRTKKQPRRT